MRFNQFRRSETLCRALFHRVTVGLVARRVARIAGACGPLCRSLTGDWVGARWLGTGGGRYPRRGYRRLDERFPAWQLPGGYSLDCSPMSRAIFVARITSRFGLDRIDPISRQMNSECARLHGYAMRGHEPGRLNRVFPGRRIAGVDLEMKVWAGRVAGGADDPDGLPGGDGLTDPHGGLSQHVAVAGHDVPGRVVVVADLHVPAAPAEPGVAVGC